MLNRLRPAIGALATSLLGGPGLLRLGGAAGLRLGLRGPGRLADGHQVVIAPPGGGNIGDQALVEATVAAWPGASVVITRFAGAIARDPEWGPESTILPIQGLNFGRLGSQVLGMWRLGRALRGARRVLVIGADTMDGAYNWRHSCNLAGVAEAIAATGRDVTVVGFSWNGSADRRAVHALQRAMRQGVRLCVRDPISRSNALRDGIGSTELVADVVFTDNRRALTERVTELTKLLGSPSALLNVSAHVGLSPAMTSAYQGVVTELQSRGFSVAVFPHVLRKGDDDVATGAQLFGLLPSRAGVTLISDMWRPSEVRALCAHVDIVVTGRMHLGILAMMQGRPALVFATQGKVEGLMESVGLPDCCVPIDFRAPSRASVVLSQVLDALPQTSSRLATTLPELARRAWRNFD